jgi:hypothetical protein
MKPAEELLGGAVLTDLALPLRSIRLMKKQSMDDTAQPARQREPEEWKTGVEWKTPSRPCRDPNPPLDVATDS